MGMLTCVCALTCAGETVTAVWTNAVSASENWTNAANWTDLEGAAITEPPTNGESVVFAPLETFGTQDIAWGDLPPMVSWTWGQVSVGALTEADPYSRRTVTIDNPYSGSVSEKGEWFTLMNPDGFNGFWKAKAGQLGFILPATSEWSTKVSNVSAAHRLDVMVPTAGTKAYVGSVFEGGALVKRGPGELEVAATTGSDTQIHVAEGTVTLGGRKAPDANDDVPVPGAIIHLDAGRPDTMTTYTGEDGRTCVTSWRDVRGNGAYAYYDGEWRRGESQTYLVPSMNAPFLNTTAVPGKPLIDFGRSGTSQNEVFGPTNCALRLSPRSAKVREVFVVGSMVGTQTSAVGDQDFYNFHPGHPYVISQSPGSVYTQTHPVRFGDIIVDGVRKGANGKWATYTTDACTLCVVSYGATNNVIAGMLGTDRLYDGRVGGCRIAEVLVYTNVLTQAERLTVHRHLQRKWTAAEGAMRDCDAGAVTLASNTTAIGVPEGRTARVTDVTAAGGTLVKTGGGVLEVEALSSLSANKAPDVDVRGGDVRFVPPAAVSCDAPATGAYLWLDAATAASLVISNVTGSATNFVAEWHDRRPEQTDLYAILPTSYPDYKGVLPHVVENRLNGLPVVQFGQYSGSFANGGTFMILSTNARSSVAYEAFAVQAYVTDAARGGGFFGIADGIAVYKAGATSRFLLDSYGCYYGRNGWWSFNGAVVDPVQDGEAPFKGGEFAVASMASPTKIELTLIGGKDRLGQGTSYGGVQTAEYIIYARKLTPAERKQTVAYLMNRWLGRKPAFAQTVQKLGTVTVPAGSPVTMNAMSGLEIDEISGGNGAFVKTGDATLKLNSTLAAQGVTSLTVAGGRLETEGTPIAGILAKTVLHFDATDLSKMTYAVTGEGENAVTNVTKVLDQRGGTVMTPKATFKTEKAGTFDLSAPTLRMAETAAGVYRPVFDFGPGYTYWASAAPAGASAGFLMSPVCTKVREAHVIYSDQRTGSSVRSGSMEALAANDSSLDYFAGGTYLLSSNSSYAHEARAGHMGVDGAKMTGVEAQSYSLSVGFHLISGFPAPSEMDANGNTEIGAMALSHTCYAGGVRCGELVAFDAPLSDSESMWLQLHLMHKWFETPMPVATNNLVSVTVNADATLAVGGSVVSAASLAGTGSVEADAVIATGALGLTAGSPLTINGTFAQAGALDVSVSIAEKPDAGEYAVLTATSFEGLDLGSWRLVSQLSLARNASFVLRGDTVYLRVAKTALLIIIR